MSKSWPLLLGSILLLAPPVAADDGLPDSVRSEAWFTGSLHSTGATALPEGHFLAEPYLGEEIVKPQGGHASHTAESLTLLLYGVTDDFTVGLIPRFAWRDRPEPGDLTARLQYRLTAYDEASSMPSLAVALNQDFPTGKFDDLDRTNADGSGTGAYTTHVALLSDEYATVAGRPLRIRFDLSYGVSTSVGIENRSAYGTPEGFRGHASPGDTADATLAFEYSLSTGWAVALDASYDRGDSTRVEGLDIHTASGTGQSANLAPALEYNWTDNTGLIVGVQLPVWQSKSGRVILPMAALNCVF